jgi:hypothetical protein
MPKTRKNPKSKDNENKNDIKVATAAEDEESVVTISGAAVSLVYSYRPEDVGSEEEEEDEEVAGTPGQTQLSSCQHC